MSRSPSPHTRRFFLRRPWVLPLVAFVMWVALQSASPSAAAGPCDPPVAKPIACENSLPGNPESEWGIFGAGDDTIQGFAAEFSLNHGETVHFKVQTPARDYRLDIYRLGYYGGLGARKVTTVQPSANLPQSQPACLADASTGLVDCGNWSVSASWAIPANATSGIYFARLVREDGTAGASHIYFVVRDDSGGSDLLFQTSDTTWQAYNTWGGASLYRDSRFGLPGGRAYKVSYNRPFDTREREAKSFLFSAEAPMVRWLERNGYDVSYTSGIDSDRRGVQIQQHRVFLSVGHDEYWSAAQRANVEAARNAGVSLAFFSGNEVFWKTRWETSIDGSGTPYRTLVCYKETVAGAKIDPNAAWTGTWRDPRFSPPADGGRPENSLTGTLFAVNGPSYESITVPQQYSALRFWRNTSVASLAPGQMATFPEGTLGYEWDEAPDNGVQPPGLIHLSSTTVNVDQYLVNYGDSYVPGPATHHLTLYRQPGGGLVFGAGTVQWTWGLDDDHDAPAAATDASMQQATVNLLADMGAQPASLQASLVAASPSSDTAAPTSTITSPAAGTSVPAGKPVTIRGTASDTGGVVAGVEISTDGGATWRHATGTTSWTYTWTPGQAGTVTIKTRATDDSANAQVPGAGLSVTVLPPQCPCSLWTASATPAATTAGNSQALEVGVRFRSEQDGYITALRFYKAPGDSGTHTGKLWTNSGQLLASVVFTSETASGWQQAPLPAPVPITANTTYVASYHTSAGGFAYTDFYFGTSAYSRPPLSSPADGAEGPNGAFVYGSGGFPTNGFNSRNYWVDVVMETTANDTIAPAISARTPAADAAGVAPSTNISATFTEPVTAGSVSFLLRDGANNSVPGVTTYDAASRTASFDPQPLLSESTTYSVTVSGASDAAGNVMAPTTWSFTTTGPAQSIWTATTTPAVASGSDNQAVELGLKFSSDIDLYVRGVRFYKGAANTGTHTGSLWTASGTLLAKATFVNESATGWQQVLFASPVRITANTTYVVSYFAPRGGYATTAAYFATAETFNYPLHALSNSAAAGNGVFRYGSAGGFPSNSYNATNYWVDVLASTTAVDTVPPSVTATSPAAGGTLSPPSNLTATFDEAVDPASLVFRLTTGGSDVPASVSYDAASRTATLDPSAPLTEGMAYTATVAGARDLAGNPMASPFSWNFSTPTCPCSIWGATATPSIASNSDTQGVELGLKFRVDSDGYITGVRFYKGAANTGTHTGSLWSSAGVRLATVTFANETASGWQQAMFSTPVAVTPGQTYTVSYYAPRGGYSTDMNYFASAGRVSGALAALANGVDGGNGVYHYGPSGFPTDSYFATNYWVDVVFAYSFSDTAGPMITGITATASASTATISWTTDEGATSQVEFGTTTAYGTTTALDATLQTSHSVALSGLTSETLYHYRVLSRDARGNLSVSSDGTFTTLKACPCTIWSASQAPAVPSQSDTSAVELGLKFRADINGFVTGARFYKGPANTGTHTASLWTATGTLLATATFTNETASGWQQVTFATPVAVTAGTTYVISYHAPNGGYAVTSSMFASAGVDSWPLHALANGVDGPNGVYRYGPSAFPTDSYSASNYWVDVVFATQ